MQKGCCFQALTGEQHGTQLERLLGEAQRFTDQLQQQM